MLFKGISRYWREGCSYYDEDEERLTYFSTSVNRFAFWKIFGINFFVKRSPNIGPLFGYLENSTSFNANCFAYNLTNCLTKLGFFLIQHLVTLFSTFFNHAICDWKNVLFFIRIAMLPKFGLKSNFFKIKKKFSIFYFCDKATVLPKINSSKY